MKQILLIFALFTIGIIHAHKDRVEVPEKIIFTLKNKEIVSFEFTDSKLKDFCDDIVSRKKEISGVQLFYKTGEVVTVESDGKNWSLFKITFKGKNLYVPQEKLKKIPEIHFSALYLFWSGESNAFSSRYLCLRFDIGTQRSFGVFPNLELHFSNSKFSKSEVWTQASENSRHGKAF
ncbi:hypothetical protein ACFSJW_00120 [Flavobacterium artemisiae]|uniref:GLPGLI family protein n=1 Tax=Flavobacterium artemisiae TaxID=2126556 RepID=A0ABW4HHQ4_9FLAO